MRGGAIFSMKDIDRGWKRLVQLERQLRDQQTYVKVGVIGDRKNPERGSIDTVGLAIVHEYGVPSLKIPERSWIRSTFDMQLPKLHGMVRAYVGKIYDGTMTPERALGLLGATLSADIKNRVTQGQPIPPPNAPATLERKMALSRRSLSRNTRKAAKNDGVALKRGAAQGPLMIRTLVDTGRMVNSVSWVTYVEGKEQKDG